MDIAEAAEDIRSMRVRGAGKIGKHAVAALASFADGWDGNVETLENAAAVIVAARPTAVSLPNAVEFVLRRVKRAPPADRPRVLREAADEFLARGERALDELARCGATLIQDDMTVITICHSQGAIRPIIEAHNQGRRFRVVALETRPWRQGLLTAAQLHEAGLGRVAIAVDSAAWTLLKDADLVLCGADTVARNGDVINKVGTGGLAVLAHERGVPMYSCTETFKIHPTAARGEDVEIEEREVTEVVTAGEIPHGVAVRNAVFDVTEARYLKGYVTELGVLKPFELWPAARKAWEME